MQGCTAGEGGESRIIRLISRHTMRASPLRRLQCALRHAWGIIPVANKIGTLLLFY